MSDERYVDAPPEGAEGWAEVWREDKRYRSRRGFLDKLFRRFTSADRDRQRDFNLVLLDLVRDLREDARAIRREVRADLDSLQRDVQRGDEQLARDIAEVRDLIPIASRRNDALIAALDQKIETLAVRLRDITNAPATGGAVLIQNADYIYRRLEDGMRGSGAEVRDAMRAYIDLARDHQPVLDVGCGRGEFLGMCREDGIDARGFDTNERSIADLEHRGIRATLAGVPDCFSTIADSSVGSILAAHVVEHLPVEHLFALFREAHRVLRKDGLLMIETPNAESLLVSGSEFWRDPTHLAPRHPAALALLAREHGFAIDEMRAIHPFPEGTALAVADDDPPALRKLVTAINERLFGPQDLRAILRKH